MIAKQITTEETNATYTLYEEVEMETPAGETTTVLKSIGNFSIDQLGREKTSHTEAIAKIDEKIATINLLNE